jgi:hypothetical protein
MPSPEASRANGFKSGNKYSNGRPKGRPNIRSEENRLKWEARGYPNPLDFYGSVLVDPNEPTETKIAAANAAIPYLESKLGAIPAPAPDQYFEEAVNLPRPTSIRQAYENIALLTEYKSQGKIAIAKADSLINDQRIILDALIDEQKLLTAQGGPPQQIIKIEGGLPALLGTNIIMPDGTSTPGEPLSMNGHGPQPSDQDPEP